MKERIKSSFGALCVAAALALVMFTVMDRLATDKAYGQASTPQVLDAQIHGDWTFTSVNVKPVENPTNVAAFYDSTGTNCLRINPTNSRLEYVLSGTIYRGFAPTTGTNVTLTNASGTRTLVIRNGIIVDVQ